MKWHQASRSLILILCLLNVTGLDAAPLKIPTSLPLDSIDLEKAKTELGERDAAAFALFFTSQLTVLPDHTNRQGSQEDRSTPKKFHVLPLFQIAADRENAGGQEIAEYAMKIIKEIERLVSRLSFDVTGWQRLEQSIQDHKSRMESLRQSLPAGLADSDPRLVALTNLKQNLERLEAEKAQLQEAFTKQSASIDSASRQSLFNVVLEELQKLGITPQANETQLLQSAVVQENFQGLSSILARAVKFGLFGSRQMIFDASYDAQQKKFISLYKRLRPDVQVVPLPTKTISVKLTASSIDATQRPESPNRLFLGVNTGTKGRCGNNRSCNVMIDYNFAGALAARVKAGKSVAPIIFEAATEVAAPAWTGSVNCRAPNTFWESPNAWQEVISSCQVEGGGQLDDEAAYHVTRNLDLQFRSLIFEPSALSLVEKASLFQTTENAAAQPSWASAFPSRSALLASFGLTEAVSMTLRIPYTSADTGKILGLEFHSKADASLTTEIFTFDGLPAFCWKKDSILPQSPAFIASCQEEVNTTAGGDTDTGRAQRLCQNLSYDACQHLADEAKTDDKGLIREPEGPSPESIPSWEDIWR
jgi:hypothetical protein